MPDKRWKAHERQAAKIVDPENGERNPSNGKRNNDIDALEVFAVEHKSIRGEMRFIRKAMHQAIEGARKKGAGQTPVVFVASGVGKGKLRRWAIMDLEEWAKLARLYAREHATKSAESSTVSKGSRARGRTLAGDSTSRNARRRSA
jgi:hypothetical protein